MGWTTLRGGRHAASPQQLLRAPTALGGYLGPPQPHWLFGFVRSFAACQKLSFEQGLQGENPLMVICGVALLVCEQERVLRPRPRRCRSCSCRSCTAADAARCSPTCWAQGITAAHRPLRNSSPLPSCFLT